MTNRLMAGASRFAHFAGIGRARAEDDDKREDDRGAKRARKAEDDDDEKHDQDRDARKARAEDDDDKRDDEKDANRSKRARAEEDDDDKRAEEDDEDRGDEDRKAKRSKRARAEESDEDDDDDKAASRRSRKAADDDDDEDDDKHEMSGRSAAAAARRRERARCAAIFASPQAVNNIPLACSLAFETTMTRSEALAVMRGQAGRASSVGAGREARNPQMGPGGHSPSGGQAVQASWDQAINKVVPRK